MPIQRGIAAALPECLGAWVERNGHRARYHVLSYLGESWCKGEPRFPDELVVGYTKHVTSKGGVVTWDVPIERSCRNTAALCRSIEVDPHVHTEVVKEMANQPVLTRLTERRLVGLDHRRRPGKFPGGRS